MPYHVARSRKCSASKGWAVIKTATGEVVACHVSRAMAAKQIAAIMSHERDMAESSNAAGGVHVASKKRPTSVFELLQARSFCPTGKGGGVDNSCGKGEASPGKPLPSYAHDIEHSMPKSRGFDDPANAQSWLSPSGTFFPVSGDHGLYAERHGVDGGGDLLLDAGWLRVAGWSGTTLYVGNTSGFAPKGRQLSALRDFAISTGRLKRVIFDNGKSRSGHVLWQSDDSRAFCPTGEGNGIDNSCGAGEGHGAGRVWSKNGETVGQWLDRHRVKTDGGRYVFYHARPKGSDYDTLLPGSKLETDAADAAFFAARDRDLDPETDIEVIRVLATPDDINPGVFASLRRPYRMAARRAFCPTGEGGGIDNSCGGTATAIASSDTQARVFPAGSQSFRDAVDSVAPSPELIWDRSRGRADTPSPRRIDEIASEQSSHSGVALTPEAEASYSSLVDEIGRQYEALTAAGLKARAWRGDGEPYGDPPGSTRPNSDRMREEVARTGEFMFFRTDSGFGTGDATPNHPMLRPTRFRTADGEPMVANDLFRVVHDMVAHVRGGFSFSTNGEYNGMLTHASTLPESAWPALFAETFGQNAVYEKTKQYAPQNAYASKVGPQIIREELKRRNRNTRAATADDSDEPLGWQHIKSRPALLAAVGRAAPRRTVFGLLQSRAFCPTGEGGGIKNDCSSKDDGSGHVSSGWGDEELDWGSSEDREVFTADTPMFRGAERIERIEIKYPDDCKKILSGLGISLPNALSASGLCLDGIERLGLPKPVVSVSPGGYSGEASGSLVVRWACRDSDGSPIAAERTIVPLPGGRGFAIEAHTFHIRQAHRGRGLALEMMTNMISSGAREIRIREAARATDESDPSHNLDGYAAWPKYGYDCSIGEVRRAVAARGEEIFRRLGHLHAPQHAGEVPPQFSGAKSLLDIYEMPGGREWWKENGDSVRLTFDAKPGSRSLSVLRQYQEASRKKHERRSRTSATAGGESDSDYDPILDELWDEIVRRKGASPRLHSRAFCPNGQGNGVTNTCGGQGSYDDLPADMLDSPGVSYDAGKSPLGEFERRDVDCGRDDDGKFTSGNKCGSFKSIDMPKEDPRGRLRYDNGVQTDAARKLYRMGSSEKKLKALVEAVGGDPKSTRVDINPPSINISVADASGNKLFHVDFEHHRARVYPAKDLTPKEASAVRKAAKEAFASDRSGDFGVRVFTKADDMKKWESENAKKLQKWEDKYAFSTLLPPHLRPKKWERSFDARYAGLLAFAQSRAFCATGEGGGVDNSCASGDAPADEKTLSDAVKRWKGFTSDIGIHVDDEISGAPQPGSQSGRRLREQAKALLRAVTDDAEPAPKLYRGDTVPPEQNTSTLLGWTSDRNVAEKWAKVYGGQVYTLEGAKGLDLSRFSRDGSGRDDFGESEWIVLHRRPGGGISTGSGRSLDARLLAFAQSRAFCATGEGGGVKNDCSSKDGTGGDSQQWKQGATLQVDYPRDYWTKKDREETYTVRPTNSGKIPVIDRRDTSTSDYLDEIECHGAECGLTVTFDEAKEMQGDNSKSPYKSQISPDWSPLDAYIGKGYGYFTGSGAGGGDAADQSIDFHGAEYGAIDEDAASELMAEKQRAAEDEWESLDKQSEYGERWLAASDDEKEEFKQEWLQQRDDEIQDEVDALRADARDKAVAEMKHDLESALAYETLDCCLQLYRGITVDSAEAERILRGGYVTHDSVNSWTTSRGTARSFGGNKLLLVVRRPRVGYVFAPNTHEEAEVVRPPSRMKITGAVRTKTGMVLYVDEDVDYVSMHGGHK